MIRNIQLNHGGKYVCVIDTDVESLSTSAILVVKGKRAKRICDVELVFTCRRMNTPLYLGCVNNVALKHLHKYSKRRLFLQSGDVRGKNPPRFL